MEAMSSQVTSIKKLAALKDQKCQNFEAKVAKHEKALASLQADHSSLVEQLAAVRHRIREEQDAVAARTNELDLRETAFAKRKHEYDEQYKQLSIGLERLKEDRESIKALKTDITTKQLQQEQLQQRLDAQAKALAVREQEVIDSAKAQAEIQKRLDQQAAVLSEKEKKLATQAIPSGAPTVSKNVMGPAIAAALTTSRQQNLAGRTTARTIRDGYEDKQRIGNVVNQASTTIRTEKTRVVIESTAPRTTVGSGVRPTVAISAATEKSATRAPIRAGPSAAPAHDQRANAPRAAMEPRSTSGATRTGFISAAQPAVVSTKTTYTARTLAHPHALTETLKRKADPCEASSVPKRVMRSAPILEKSDPVPRSKATFALSKWSDEALRKETGRAGAKPPIPTARNVIKQTPAPLAAVSTCANNASHPPRSQVPISKRRMNFGVPAARMVMGCA
jgi:hypothetical protein